MVGWSKRKVGGSSIFKRLAFKTHLPLEQHLASLFRKRRAPAESKPRSMSGRSGFTFAAGTWAAGFRS